MTARLLIVDDVPANARLLEARLQAEYFEVRTASSGAACLRMVTEGRVDLVLLDVLMPICPGFEAFAAQALDIGVNDGRAGTAWWQAPRHGGFAAGQ